jgi:hypothetical protein
MESNRRRHVVHLGKDFRSMTDNDALGWPMSRRGRLIGINGALDRAARRLWQRTGL